MEPAIAKEKDSKKIDEYQVDNAVRVLLEAEEIKQNKPLMALVHKKMHKKKRAIESIADLKMAREEMDADEEEGDEDSDD